MVFNVVPTAFEVALVAGILAYKCGPAFAGLTAGTIVAYTAFTFSITQVHAGLGPRDGNHTGAGLGPSLMGITQILGAGSQCGSVASITLAMLGGVRPQSSTFRVQTALV